MSNYEERMRKLLSATQEELEAVDSVLEGKRDEPPVSLRLYRMGEAAKAINTSRTTLWRAIRDGSLMTIEIRKGSHRISSAELIRFANGGAK